MPREWNEAQRDAMERLAEMLNSDEIPLSHPAAVTIVPIEPARLIVANRYLVLINGFGLNANREILCGPFTAEQAREERASLRGLSGWRIVTQVMSHTGAASLCGYCTMPRGFAHQLHCRFRVQPSG